MVAYPNPALDEIHFEQLKHPRERLLGDIAAAARVAGVQPGTIQVWVSRGKIEPVLQGSGGTYYHLPTVRAAREGGKSRTPKNPAANSRGPHRHQSRLPEAA